MQTDASSATNPSAKDGADFCKHLTTTNPAITLGCSTGLIEGAASPRWMTAYAIGR